MAAPETPASLALEPGMRLTQALAVASQRLGDRFEAEMLLGHVLGRDRAWLMMHGQDALDAQHAERFRVVIERRAAGEPVAYLMGLRGFWKMDLHVGPEVLIPRPETELLVEQALERLPADTPARVADLGTGSGAVALALALERPRAEVLASDVSAAALAVARGNAERLGLACVEFVRGAWWQPLRARRFNLIVSNPPYVAADDAHLEQGDLRFEPGMALASGADGLDAIRTLVAGAPAHLEPGGWLLLEHGWDQGAAVRALLAEAGLQEVHTTADLQGHDRVAAARASR